MAKGVGTAKIIGRIHAAPIQLGEAFFTMSITILESKDMQFLFGLDQLRRHQAWSDTQNDSFFPKHLWCSHVVDSCRLISLVLLCSVVFSHCFSQHRPQGKLPLHPGPESSLSVRKGHSQVREAASVRVQVSASSKEAENGHKCLFIQRHHANGLLILATSRHQRCRSNAHFLHLRHYCHHNCHHSTH
jgi:hypothetical protein